MTAFNRNPADLREVIIELRLIADHLLGTARDQLALMHLDRMIAKLEELDYEW